MPPCQVLPTYDLTKGCFDHPYIAAARGYIDDVIDPIHTRRRLIESLLMLEHKTETRPPKRHGNIPL